MIHARSPRSALATAAALAAMIGLGCSSSNKYSGTDSAAGTAAVPGTTPAAAPSTPSTDTAGRSAASLSDANILAKANVGDSTESAAAKYMAANASSSAVKSYAELLERDHAKGISKVEAVAKKTGLTLQLPQGDTTIQAAQHAMDHLKSLSGKDRDTAFVNHEIEDHQHDIDETQRMAASATNPEVKSLLENELPELRKHLDRAQALSKQLAGGKS